MFLFSQIDNLLKQLFLSEADFLQISQFSLKNGFLVLCVSDLEADVVHVLQRVLHVIASESPASVNLKKIGRYFRYRQDLEI